MTIPSRVVIPSAYDIVRKFSNQGILTEARPDDPVGRGSPEIGRNVMGIEGFLDCIR